MGLAPRCDEPAGDTVLRLVSCGVLEPPEVDKSWDLLKFSGELFDLLRDGTRVLSPLCDEALELGRLLSISDEDDDDLKVF